MCLQNMPTKHPSGPKKGGLGRSWLDCRTAHGSPDRGRGAGGKVRWGSTGSREEEEAALGEPAQGVDSHTHGAGKHHAERWSCFNEKMLL